MRTTVTAATEASLVRTSYPWRTSMSRGPAVSTRLVYIAWHPAHGNAPTFSGELTVRNTAADTGWTLALRLSRSTSVPCRHSAIQEITVWLHSARSGSSFHLFCADLDAAVINLSNFPNLRCQFYESSGTAAARKALSRVPVYMPNLSEDMVVIHGATDGFEDEETRPAEQMTAFPSHYWLGDYDTPPARQNSPTSHVLGSGQPSTSAAVSAVQGQALLENDMTMVGYSY